MLNNVQALRAVAAFLVVFVHLKAFALALGLGSRAFEFGNSGVDLFFVVSGMIMVLTTSRKRPSPRMFLSQRIARIVPFYWLATLGVFAIAVAAPQLLTGTQADPQALLFSLFFVPHRRPDGMVMPTVFVGWTLNYEMAFYLAFAASLGLPNRRLGLGLTIGLLVVAVLLGLRQPEGVLANFYTRPIVLEFALGMLIGAAAERSAPAQLHDVPRTRIGAAALAALLAAFAIMLCALAVWPEGERLLIWGLPATVIVASAVLLERTGRFVRYPPLILLGNASFAIYLTHFFVTQAMIKAAAAMGVTGGPAVVLMIALTLGMVAFVGVAAHLAVEMPLLKLFRRVMAGRSAGKYVAEKTPGSRAQSLVGPLIGAPSSGGSEGVEAHMEPTPSSSVSRRNASADGGGAYR